MTRLPTRGFALVVVMWILVLITILVGTFTVLARTESMQSRFLFDATQARYAAEAGIHRAVLELRSPEMETRWVGDGRSYTVEFGTAILDISITDETGKININSADEELLTNLFVSRGVDEAQAMDLADAIIAWRDPSEEPPLYGPTEDDYYRAGYPYGPKNGPFETIDELQQVMGMSYGLFMEVEPAITIHGARGSNFNMAYAPLEALMADPEIDRETAERFIEEREMMHPSDGEALILPDGTPVMARGGGVTYSIRSRGILENGVWAEVEATVMLGTDTLGRPFRVLRWKENTEN